jgi:hypothetical protein
MYFTCLFIVLVILFYYCKDNECSIVGEFCIMCVSVPLKFKCVGAIKLALFQHNY